MRMHILVTALYGSYHHSSGVDIVNYKNILIIKLFGP